MFVLLLCVVPMTEQFRELLVELIYYTKYKQLSTRDEICLQICEILHAFDCNFMVPKTETKPRQYHDSEIPPVGSVS